LDTATLIIVHRVLSLGSVRQAARSLGRPVATVSGALSRFQTHLATPLTTKAGNRLVPTLEGRRINRELETAAHLIAKLEQLGERSIPVFTSLSLLALSRFNVIGRTGSIRAAAKELRMGQPQLTRQINALEQQLGLKLLERSSGGVAFTRDGSLVLTVSEKLVGIWQQIAERSDDRFRQARRRIRLGAVTPLGWQSGIAADLARLAAEWPRLHPRSILYVSSNSADELLAGLSRRQHDLVLLDTEEVPAPMEHLVLSRSSLAVVGSPDMLRRHDENLVSLLTQCRLALPSPKSGLRQKFIAFADDILRPQERSRLSVVEIDSIPVIANLVVDHDHISLLPLSALQGMGRRMAAIPLPARYDMPLTLAWRPHVALNALAQSVEMTLKQAGASRP
jgi:molybdate transport repressor ModE-like protein